MAEITASAVKDLRERTGAGMMDCKKALAEANGDMEAAVDWLRTKGLAAASKKAGRTAAEGLVGVTVLGTIGAAVEVNSETDFVAKNEQFQEFVRNVAQIAVATGGDMEELGRANYPGHGSVQEALTHNIATIGENQQLRRAKRVEVGQGAVVSYVHNQVASGLGKIGVLVALESPAGADVLEPLGKQLAMHIAAAAPMALDADGIDPDVLERERGIARDKAIEAGKPEAMLDKIAEGAVGKFRKENALLSQPFVIDNKTPIADVVAQAAKEAGQPIVLKDYVRLQLGEGIARQTSDFAAEVAAAAGVRQDEPEPEPEPAQ